MKFDALIDGLLAHPETSLMAQQELDEILTLREGLLQWVFETRRIPMVAKEAWKEAVWRACHSGIDPVTAKPAWRGEREQLENLRVFRDKLSLTNEQLAAAAKRRSEFFADLEARKQRAGELEREAQGYIERVGGTLDTDPEGLNDSRVLRKVRELQGITG